MNKHNRTRRYKRGGQPQIQPQPQNNITKKNMSSIFSTIQNAVKQTANYAVEKGARFLGYKKIDDQQPGLEQRLEAAQLKQKANELGEQAQELASGFMTKASQVGAIVTETLNKSIEDSGVKEKIGEALGNTVGIATGILKEAEEKLNTPEFVNEVSQVTKKVADDASLVLEAADPAINKVIDQTSVIAEKMGTKVGDAAVNIVLNTAEAIPGIGAAIGLGRDIDSATKATGAVIEAGTDTITSLVNGFKETEDALKKKMEEARALQERTAKGISAFNSVDKIAPSIRSSIQQSAINSLTKRPGAKRVGGTSKKFRKMRRKLSRKLHFRQPE
jgi:hypothetical protein